MELSPEEKKKIYEEEKARIEAREQIEREKKEETQGTGVGLAPNVAGLLCYVGGWITGIIFFILEQKNTWVRFHATQSIITFGIIHVAALILGVIPIIGSTFSGILYFIGFILWLVLMVKTYNGERIKLAWIGDIAERMANPGGEIITDEIITEQKPSETTKESTEKVTLRESDKHLDIKARVRIASSAIAIAWSIVLLIFFNYFYDYVAYYGSERIGNATVWTRTPFFTEDIHMWLPILTTTLVISIIGHIVLLIVDRYVLREVIHFFIDSFSLATVITLLKVYPFDFSAIPDTSIANSVHLGVNIVLIFISIGIGIGLLVRLIKLIVNLTKDIAGYQD